MTPRPRGLGFGAPDQAEADQICERLAAVIRLDRELPQQVFTPGWGHFCFFGFLSVYGEAGWALVQRLGQVYGDKGIAIVLLKASDDHEFEKAELWGKARFATVCDRYPARSIPLDTPEAQYHAAMHDIFEPPGPRGIFDLYGALSLVILPDSGQWAIWGERFPDTSIVAFRRPPIEPFPQIANASGIRPLTIAETLAIGGADFGVYEDEPSDPADLARFNAYKEEFLRNYGEEPGGG